MLLSENRCFACKETFSSTHALYQHTENLKAFACVYCTQCKDLYHLESSKCHHNFSYYCKICHSYLSANDYLNHKCFHRKSSQKKANRTKVTCDTCRGTFFSKDDLISHIQACGKNILLCECCNQEFLNNDAYLNHMTSAARIQDHEKQISCNKCHLGFENEDCFKKHLKNDHVSQRLSIFRKPSQSKLTKYECRFCQKQFLYKNDKTSHEKQLHFTETVSCPVCHKDLPFNRLGPHSRWHRTREKYKTKPRKVCDICGFASKFIARHMKIHKEERRYKCNVCNKSFKLSSCLSNHKLVHSDVARHKCHICDKAFKSNFNLQVHLRSHDAVKPFSCLVCEKTFTTKQSRDNHLKTHDR